jgi:hypothetical protein
MTNLTTFFNEESLTSGNYTSILTVILKHKRWLLVDFSGKRYVFFLFNNKIYCVSEFMVCLILSSLSYFGVIGFRLIIEKLKLKQKTKKLFQASKIKTIRLVKTLRGGSDGTCSTEPSFEEPNSLNLIDISLVPFPVGKLSQNDLYIKQIIRKCIKQNQVYRITNPMLVKLVNSMVAFQSRENVRSISQELFSLALVVAMSNPTKYLMFDGLALKQRFSSYLLSYSPMIASIGIGILFGIFTPLNGIGGVLRAYLTRVSSTAFIAYMATSNLRSYFFIDCENYVQQLPIAEITRIAPSVIGPDLNVNNLITTKEPYVRVTPSKQDIFITTNQKDFNYQHDFETLDGVWKKQRTVDGQSFIGYSRHKNSNGLLPSSHYEKLKTRTKTWCDLIKYDSTDSRNSARKIIKAVSKERFIKDAIEESLE